MKTCELLATIEFDGVSKTLTHHRMHLKCSKTFQMNPSMHSFQNMCDMLYAKVNRLAGKIDFIQKQP